MIEQWGTHVFEVSNLKAGEFYGQDAKRKQDEYAKEPRACANLVVDHRQALTTRRATVMFRRFLLYDLEFAFFVSSFNC